MVLFVRKETKVFSFLPSRFFTRVETKMPPSGDVAKWRPPTTGGQRRLMDVIRRLQDKALDCQSLLIDHFVPKSAATVARRVDASVKNSFKRRRSGRNKRRTELGVVIQRSADFQAIREKYQRAIDQNTTTTDGSLHVDGCRTLRARVVRHGCDGDEFWRRRATSGDEEDHPRDVSAMELKPRIAARISIINPQRVPPTKSSSSSSSSASSLSSLCDDDGKETRARSALWRRRYVERICDPAQKSKILPSRLMLRHRDVRRGPFDGGICDGRVRRIAQSLLEQQKHQRQVLQQQQQQQQQQCQLKQQASVKEDDKLLGGNDRRVSTQSSESHGSDSSGYCSGVDISPSDRLQNLMQRAGPKVGWQLRILRFMGDQLCVVRHHFDVDFGMGIAINFQHF
ncbi:unnamed protein product [Notodromas monacha]|uniref:Uncharacterized protein n=1 Tax=Notodromas monacha TaxID=399045 RepID=A0A7R9BEU9_9CRUS|nr:unnamed protein product [Notodromas monacha]CAG0912904.1 unnamed protein product [Notodromas monacha]